MATKIQDLAAHFEAEFVTGTREDGTRFLKCKDSENETLTQLIYDAHGEMLPDDYRYEFIHDALAAIAEYENPEEAIEAVEADIYTQDLTAWLHSRNDRVNYLSEVQEEFGPLEDGFQLLAAAQHKEKTEVFYSVLQSLRDLVEPLN